jgi:hypothetical protein
MDASFQLPGTFVGINVKSPGLQPNLSVRIAELAVKVMVRRREW